MKDYGKFVLDILIPVPSLVGIVKCVLKVLGTVVSLTICYLASPSELTFEVGAVIVPVLQVKKQNNLST